MPMPGMVYDLIQLDLENLIPLEAKPPADKSKICDCLLTSEKIRHVLTKFPASQPIPPTGPLEPKYGYCKGIVCNECVATNLMTNRRRPIPEFPSNNVEMEMHAAPVSHANKRTRLNRVKKGRDWSMVGELFLLLRFAVGAAALALYYAIYGSMSFVYVALRVALYFRQADKPMKITLGVMAVTSLVVGLNILLRIRKIYTSILRQWSIFKLG